jgi:hypothetical protein
MGKIRKEEIKLDIRRCNHASERLNVQVGNG